MDADCSRSDPKGSVAEDNESPPTLEPFTIIKEFSSVIEAAKWPTGCEVLDETIKHIYYNPPEPEEFYVPTGEEEQPMPIGEKSGTTVYDCYPKSNENSRFSIGGSSLISPPCRPPREDSLMFESRFESGNLAKAIKISDTHYELYLRNDLYTKSHNQWFYFRVTNMKKNVTYRFSIVNLKSEESLYKKGMKPLLYSTKNALLYEVGWKRCGENITYFCNEIVKPNAAGVMTYTLTFTLNFPHSEDTVYLAYSYPYTYSDLQQYLLQISKHPVKSRYATLKLLCRTLAGNNLYYLTITAPQHPIQPQTYYGQSNRPTVPKKPIQPQTSSQPKRVVIITARVHPSEAPSSWIMKGVIDFLIGNSRAARLLRENFIFTLVPMLNPDGVIVGNTRCSLAGADLNREYRTATRSNHPTIWYTKLMIKSMLEEHGVAMYCDFHAHSTKQNIFIYGCENLKGPDKRLAERRFPLLLYKNSADKFSLDNCEFNIEIFKESTARVFVWRMGIDNSYTMEASFGGSSLGTKAETHFTVKDYEEMGLSFCLTLLDFYSDDHENV